MDGQGTEEERKEIQKMLARISKREMMDVIKQAFKEIMHEQARDFGYWSIKTLLVFIGAGLICAAFYFGGWPK